MIADLPLQARLDLDDIYEYCVKSENGRVFWGIPGPTLKQILEDRTLAGRMVFHRNAYGRIDGLLLWYRLNQGWTMERVTNWQPDDEDGDEIFISAAISDNADARRSGVLRMIAKEPDVIYLKLSALRHKAKRIKPERVEYSQKMLSRMMK